MKAAFVKQGGIIDQSSEALRYLDYRGAEAVTFNESTIMLRENQLHLQFSNLGGK